MSEIGYDDFIEMCCVDDPLHWQGMVVKADGVWVEPPPGDLSLFPCERAALSAHPKKDLTTPALKFPCTDRDLRIFLKWVADGLVEAHLGPEVTNLQQEEKVADACLEPEIMNLELVEVGTADASLETEVTKTATEKKKGGRPKGPLYEAVEFAYVKFRDEGNTEILRKGKVAEFLDRLKDLAGGKNQKISDYIAERIGIVKKRNDSFTITTPERVVKEAQGHIITRKRSTYSKDDVSKLLTALRKKFPLPS